MSLSEITRLCPLVPVAGLATSACTARQSLACHPPALRHKPVLAPKLSQRRAWPNIYRAVHHQRQPCRPSRNGTQHAVRYEVRQRAPCYAGQQSSSELVPCGLPAIPHPRLAQKILDTAYALAQNDVYTF